ncbi:MAG: hypothetical protein KUL83_12865 [Lentimicrobium sp.]|nr:hypothetical protein [Lentimicrobium sp.]MDD2528625.1 hypothetical protein [Lentimicrobiaceae bacterium]MDD4597766.1 hypothetical protein [Lentimicrobiaceae bacterium]MDY0025860.1 hypothetical protein [Lentimicrobium sp.]
MWLHVAAQPLLQNRTTKGRVAREYESFVPVIQHFAILAQFLSLQGKILNNHD